MDAGIPTTEETCPQGDDSVPGPRARARRQPAGRKPKPCIEDYFNAAKNHGIGLGHVFCAQSNGSKNFYSLMQIAGILWTIIRHSFLMRVYDWAARATETALALAIAEGMRSHRFPPLLPEPGQLRFIT